jgi:hypothetical protein
MENLILYDSPYNKIRIGKSNDGGYVVCELPDTYDLFISGGISNDISFEVNFLTKYSNNSNSNLKCYAFDGTISNLPSIDKTDSIDNINSKIIYINKNLGYENSNTDTETIQVTNLYEYMKDYSNIFMKIDIEGHEFRLLPSIIFNNNMNKIKQLVIEIHTPADIQMFPDYFKGLSDIKNENMFELLNNINKTHTLVHFHANNGCNKQIIDNIEVPHVFECTYIRNDYYNIEKVKNIIPLPMYIDMKNIPQKEDFYINYYPFCNESNENTSQSEYIFIIYSCKKKLSYANNIYNQLKNKLINCTIYIIYGDTTIEGDYKMLYNYIILNVEDDYYNLSKKTIAVINTVNTIFPSIKGMFKCDDDIIPNIHHLNTFISSNIIKENQTNYCGQSINHKTSYYCENKDYKYSSNSKLLIPLVDHCPGPLYFLSKISMNIFSNYENIVYHECEDILVGLTLNIKEIFPNNYNLFSNEIENINSISIHNHKRNNDLFNFINNNNLTIRVQGGLGNQLFQIISALGFCYKFNKNLILSKNNIMENTHENKEKTINNIKTIFPDINIVDNLDIKNYQVYREENTSTFSYININIDLNKNVALEGYFINEKYFSESFLELFKYNIPLSTNTLKYNEITNNFTHTYFIHIRLGDYVNSIFYNINLQEYYIYCINKIKEQDNLSKFIICTNEYGINLNKYINNFPTDTEYIIQDSNNDALDTLYIMSSCKGGIASNSTLSWIGLYFQKNRKIENNNEINPKDYIFMPYPWINFMNGYNKNNTIDIYPEWTQVYDTISNKIISNKIISN